ncbi:MAG: hypothetical protein QXZ25_05590 [Candidatus Bathyarchaeia archaeon]
MTESISNAGKKREEATSVKENIRKPQPLNCPQCGSTRYNKAGFRYLSDGTAIQRLSCKECGYRFSQPKFSRSNRLQRLSTIHTKSLNLPSSLFYDCQGSYEALSGAPTGQQRPVKPLAAVDNPSKSGLAGATETFSANHA